MKTDIKINSKITAETSAKLKALQVELERSESYMVRQLINEALQFRDLSLDVETVRSFIRTRGLTKEWDKFLIANRVLKA